MSLTPFTGPDHLGFSNYMVPHKGKLNDGLHAVNGVTPETVHQMMLERFKTKSYACVGATAAFATDEYRIGLYPALGTPEATAGLARDLVQFTHDQASTKSPFTSFLAVFASGEPVSEKRFEELLWRQLALLDQASSPHYPWDASVASEPNNSKFAFSFASKAFFVLGMHPNASREARRFPYPVLAFNLHEQFEALRSDGRFEAMRQAIRHRDAAQHGSINPMLADFGHGSEAAQYSGRQVGKEWKCPFHHQ